MNSHTFAEKLLDKFRLAYWFSSFYHKNRYYSIIQRLPCKSTIMAKRSAILSRFMLENLDHSKTKTGVAPLSLRHSD